MIFSFVLLIYVSVHTMTRTASPSVPALSITGVSLSLSPHATMRPLLVILRRAVASGISQQPLRAVNHWTR
jgi:hypothetical protein